jgi:hypothetical protein
MSDAQPRRGVWVSYAAALWASIFAGFHIVWALGWYLFLNAPGARVAFATPWKWWFDVAVAALCVVAVPVVLAPVMSWGQRMPLRPIYTLACVGSALLVLRSVASLVQAGYLVASGRFRFAVIGGWEPWFYLGAVLFCVSTWQSRPGRGQHSHV